MNIQSNNKELIHAILDHIESHIDLSSWKENGITTLSEAVTEQLESITPTHWVEGGGFDIYYDDQRETLEEFGFDTGILSDQEVFKLYVDLVSKGLYILDDNGLFNE